MSTIQMQYQKPDSTYEALYPVMLGIIPIGGIIMWSGVQDAIPQYWHLCDGTSGTPDLRNRFIVGAGSSYQVGDMGGAEDVTLSVAQIPSHKHTFSGNFKTDKALTSVKWATELSGFAENRNKTVMTATNDYVYNTNLYSHSHTITGTGTIGFTGSGQAHENRPPYYALCFIMRIQ